MISIVGCVRTPIYSSDPIAEPLDYLQPTREDRSRLCGRTTVIATRCVGVPLVAVAELFLFGSGVGLDKEPWLASIEVCSQVGVIVTGIGIVRLRATPPYPMRWTNAGVALLWPFFGFYAFRIVAEIITHPTSVTTWSPGDLMEVAPSIFLAVMTCLVIRISFINRRYWLTDRIEKATRKVNQS
jgi:hypothetical protein